jgi:hypothetical protein
VVAAEVYLLARVTKLNGNPLRGCVERGRLLVLVLLVLVLPALVGLSEIGVVLANVVVGSVLQQVHFGEREVAQ